MSAVPALRREGVLFILSAPSGAGKTTISRRALEEIPGLELSVSCTTRAPRAGEIDGIDYRFLASAAFEVMRGAGDFAEWAKVHDHFYGTPRAPIDRAIAEGWDLLLDIDVQGAAQMRERFPQAVSVFVLPPSEDELARRLRGRGTDADDVIRRRLERATSELVEWSKYDHVIVNHDVDESVADFVAIVRAARTRVARFHRV